MTAQAQSPQASRRHQPRPVVPAEANAFGGSLASTRRAASGTGLGRFEPTVVDAVRQHPRTVAVVIALAVAVGLAYSLLVPERFRAHGSIAVPPQVSMQNQDAGQYLDSQVLLLRSPAVAARAAVLADGELGRDVLDTDDFVGEGTLLEIQPPQAANPGTFGAGIVNLAFTWSDPVVAQAGINAVMQSFDDVRVARIKAQGDATISGIDQAIQQTTSVGHRDDLLARRATALANQQIDIARHPTVVRALEPRTPINGNSKRSAAIALVVGLFGGVGLAYGRAVRRPLFADRYAPAALYAAPLLAEIPARSRDGRASPVAVAFRASPVAEAFRTAAGLLERVRAARGAQLSLAVVSPLSGGGGQAVADLAGALAEGGTRVLAVDAGTGDLTARLRLWGRSGAEDDGLEQVLAGQRTLRDCAHPVEGAGTVTVLGTGSGQEPQVRGAARASAAAGLLAEAAEQYDVVLLDSPAVLRTAAGEFVGAADAAVVVVGSQDAVTDHIDLADRLALLGAEVVGYLYDRGRSPSSARGRG